MLILLPPSEGKTAPESGPPLELGSLTSSSLTPHRRKVLDALQEVSSRPDALEILGVGKRIAADVAANTAIFDAPSAPASHVYTGVLYAAADLAGANTATASHRLDHCVRIISALWGAVSPLDVIPAYRLSMGVALPGIGQLPAFWREPLGDVLGPRTQDDVVIDCRSSTYLAAWRPQPGRAHVLVKVLRELNGRRTVVSHNAKHARGVLTGHLLRRGGSEPRTPDDVLAAARELVGTAFLEAQLNPGPRGAHTLELVVA